MTIRDLQNKDVPEVEAIYDLYWPDDFRENLSKRLKGYVENDPEIIEQGFKYFVAEEDCEVVGVAGMRKLPAHMSEYALSDHGCELYILAVKNKNQGIGKALVEKVISIGKQEKQTDLVLYSGETHKDSYAFYEHVGFEIRDANTVAPNGEKGVIFRMRL
jgi:ribosomal protein S18 acetylase RimI-like enzyme